MSLLVPAFFVLVIATVYWILTHRRDRAPSESISNIADRLHPYAETVGLDEEALWHDAIGGTPGCWNVYRAGRQMLLNVRDLPETASEITNAKSEIAVKSLLLFGATLKATYIEVPLKSLCPAWPRMNARMIAHLYWDMAISHDMAISASVQGELLPVPSGDRT